MTLTHAHPADLWNLALSIFAVSTVTALLGWVASL
jgi:hypothetical protein